MSAVALHPVRRINIGLLALLLAAFALRVVALDRLGLAYDEAASALMARVASKPFMRGICMSISATS